MFHGVMVALEFLVLSVIVRIGVEQHPLPPEFCFPRRTLFSKQCLYDTAFFVSNSFLIISSGRLHPLKIHSNLTRTYTRLRMARRFMESVQKGVGLQHWGEAKRCCFVRFENRQEIKCYHFERGNISRLRVRRGGFNKQVNKGENERVRL